MKVCPVCGTQYADDVRFCPNDGQTLRSTSPASDLVGQIIADRYHIVKKLGEGGMGQVYLGEHVKMGRRSAIKVMNPSLVHDPDAVARFNREAANASRITHPHVCAIYDFGETPEGLIYLAMEFIEGEPLTTVLDREPALPLPRATHIFQQTADALQAAHDLGIVHRDLKPDNIMISRGRDGADVVKVVDFGIAKAVGGDDAAQKVTKTGLVVGTPEYMSPEQLAGDRVDPRSDLYALALVFFRMLTGRLPFEGETVQDTMVKRLTDDPATLAGTRPDLPFPAGLQAVFDTALTRTPPDRYQSVAKFAEDVRAATGGHAAATRALPVTRATDGATQLLDTAAHRPRKRSLVPAAIAAAVLLGAGATGVVLFGGGDAPPPTLAAADSTTQGGARQPDTTGRAPVPQPLPPRPPSDTPVRHVGARLVDTAAINRELGEMIVHEPDQRALLRARAQAIYDDRAVPTRLRAEAAFQMANFYLLDRQTDANCRWVGNALRLQPQNADFTQYRERWCN